MLGQFGVQGGRTEQLGMLHLARRLAVVIGAYQDVAASDHHGPDLLSELNEATRGREIALPPVIEPVVFALAARRRSRASASTDPAHAGSSLVTRASLERLCSAKLEMLAPGRDMVAGQRDRVYIVGHRAADQGLLDPNCRLGCLAVLRSNRSAVYMAWIT